MRLATAAVLAMMMAATGPATALEWGQSSWPIIDDVNSIELHQGQTKEMDFTFENRLSIALSDAVLYIDVYARLNDRRFQYIYQVADPPAMEPVAAGDYDVVPGQVIEVRWDEMASKTSASIRIRIRTSEDTPVGVYVLRMRLAFTYQGKDHEFRSRGHFNDTEWIAALNMTFPEGVSGILPETSFEVMSRTPNDLGPILGVAAVGCLALGAYFYWKRE